MDVLWNQIFIFFFKLNVSSFYDYEKGY